ncbi:malate synthase A [Bacillus suaedaesalsae]|uniref:Malate synthase n=1 Tax=Bacillus suaedaesalsae TaxID=2810349 RepID=A0ABS2DFD6_9BACI|nr:malate synthase A [Bacillus suaedaesalsae]MBM6617170.1 malate synthase A [Bacillus suaedaesalsae]
MSIQQAGLKVNGAVKSRYEEILTQDALTFIVQLEKKFGQRRKELLKARLERQLEINTGVMPTFLKETESVRNGDWLVAPIPEDLQDRRVEITGPVDRKMIINALNSGAKVFMADFEDATSPTWENIIDGQVNLKDAIKRTISFRNDNGKEYKLRDEIATLVVRPRGWHLEEKHILLGGERISASLLDFGLYFFHNAKELMDRGSGPYFYLPKLESHLEAKLWNDVFLYAQEYLSIPTGTIKATVLIETILAAFEMDEILYELKEHSAGLNCGRWDYIFSYIKKFRELPQVIVPDRSLVTMTVPFMRAYSLLAIQTCHRRGAHAIGGMAAQIPVKGNEKLNEEAFNKVRLDKEREATDGHDGTWVAHPALVAVALDVFDEKMPGKNQIHSKREDVKIDESMLLEVPKGVITEAGIRTNINVAIQYIEAWLSGSGAVPIHNLMEDAATAEISRAQLWQWLRHPKGVLEDGRKFTEEMYHNWSSEELQVIKEKVEDDRYKEGRYLEAAQILNELVLQEDFAEFLTLKGYEKL